MKSWLLITLLLLRINSAIGQITEPLVLSENFTDSLLTRQVSFIPDSSNTIAVSDVDKNPNRRPYFHNTVVFGGINQPMWLVFDVVSRKSNISSFILNVSYIGLDGAEVFIKDGFGRILKLPKVLRRYPISARPIPDNKLLFQFSLNPNLRYTIYVKTPRAYERHMISLILWDEHTFLVSNLKQTSIFFSLLGALLLAVLVSMLLFIFLKDTIFWQYGLYVLSLCAAIFIMSGYGDPSILAINGLKFDHTTALVTVLSTSIHIKLSNSYLSVKLLAPKWLLLIGKAIIASCLLAASLFFLPWNGIHGMLLICCYQLLIFAELYIFACILLGMRRGHIPAIIYFVRFLPFIIGLPLLLNLQVLDYIYRSLELLLGAAFFEVLFLGTGIGFSYYKTRKAETQLIAKLNQTQAQVIQTQESERQRIAADLHDDLGGTLSTIRRKISDIRLRLTDITIIGAFDNLEPLITKSNDDLRRIAHNLMPPEFERIGVATSIEQLVRAIPAKPVRFEFLISGNEHKLGLETELNLYRITSELIQNILKHARAKRASVQLIYYDTNLTVMIEDDGIGFKIAGGDSSSTGIGLKNSKLRADYIGANLTTETSSSGTMTILEIPYPSSSYEPATANKDFTG